MAGKQAILNLLILQLFRGLQKQKEWWYEGKKENGCYRMYGTSAQIINVI